jgi:sarcosine oxidase gamma subunit
MVETYRRRSALAHFGLAAKAAQGVQQGTDIVLGENPHRSLINIRGDIEDAGFRETIGRVIGVEPAEANTVSSAGMRRILAGPQRMADRGAGW